jgi:hypothetical protein
MRKAAACGRASSIKLKAERKAIRTRDTSTAEKAVLFLFSFELSA